MIEVCYVLIDSEIRRDGLDEVEVLDLIRQKNLVSFAVMIKYPFRTYILTVIHILPFSFFKNILSIRIAIECSDIASRVCLNCCLQARAKIEIEE